ncbi:MAG: enoyl-CoA hydratase-related protein [Elusimicrobiota bacterium]
MSLVEVEIKDRVAVLYLNRPESLNAVSYSLVAELVAALRACDGDDSVGAMVLAGRGKAFCAGADIKEMALESRESLERTDPFSRWDAFLDIKKPLIAAVHGYALGGGMELAMCCDIIIAAEDARFAQPEIQLGIIPGAGGTQRLVRAVGKSRAMEMILTGKRIDAKEALAWGFVNKVVAAQDVITEAMGLAKIIAGNAPLAVRAAKEAISGAVHMSLADGLLWERKRFYGLFASDDQKEGMRAFTEKRKPMFKGK